MAITPSNVIRPLIPSSLHKRWGEKIDSGLLQVDELVSSSSEKSVDRRSALTAFIIRVLSAAIAFFSQVLLARWMGSHEYGIFVWVWVIAVIVGSISCIGFAAGIVRFIPEYKQRQDMEGLRGVLFGARVFSVLSATAIAATGIAGVYLFQNFITSIYVIPIYLGAICLPMLALAEIQDGIGRAQSWIRLALGPNFIIRPLLILFFMVVAIMAGFLPDAVTALSATIAACWVTSIFQMLVINGRLKMAVPDGPSKFHFKALFIVALPMFLVEGFFNLLTNVDIMIVGIYLDPSQVAIYFAAVKTLALVHFVYFAVKAGSSHRISQYYNSGDIPQYRAMVHDTVRWTFWPSLVAGLMLLAVGKFLLALFGPEFTSAYPLLFILVIGIVARAAIGPAEAILTMSGEQNICAAVYALALLVNVALNIVLIPMYGLYGAAIATTIALIFEAFALFAATKRKLNLNIFVFAPRDPLSETG